MSSLDNLWELQEIRKNYLILKKREQAALGSQKLKGLKNRESATREKHEMLSLKIKGMVKDINKREIDCQALQDKKGSLQEEMYSGNPNVKELSNMQQRLEKTQAELSNAEEDLIDLSEKLELLQASVEDLNQEIQVLENQLAVLQANLAVELQGIRHEMAEVKGVHNKVLKTIDPKTLSLYNRKFKQFSVTTVAKISGGICTGCNVHLPRYLVAEVKQGDGLVGCESCGRILYYAIPSELS